MSVDTHLYLSKRWNLSDIKEVIESHLDTKVEVKSNHDFAPGYFNFLFEVEGNKRMMHVHTDSKCPVGPCTMLSLHSDLQGISIMTTIAKTIGGIVENNDCDGKCIMYDGKLWDENGLAYHLKYAVIHNECNGESLDQMKASMNEWDKRYRGGKP